MKLYHAISLILILWPLDILLGQVTELDLDFSLGCNYYGNTTPDGRIYGFSSSQEAEDEVKRILNQVGLQANFIIKAANIPNAQAQVKNNERYILYSQQFMEEIYNKSGDYWAKVAVLAHEIGHHLNGHTLVRSGNRPLLELEADKFSGFVLYKMGASLSQAQSAVTVKAPKFATDTHPPKNARLEAIAVGYNDARETSNPEPEEGNPPPASASSVTFAGETYPVKRISGLTWMTKNMNYEVSDSWCYDNSFANCLQYSRLYTWSAAKRACQKFGWRLPTDQEWQQLIKSIGTVNSGETGNGAFTNGTNGDFNPFLGGYRYTDGSYGRLSRNGYYWSATELGGGFVSLYTFGRNLGKPERENNRKYLGFSCRCVQD